MLRVGSRFRRVEPRRRARAFVLGLLSGPRRKNCWTIAEQAGDATPDGMQHLLARAKWLMHLGLDSKNAEIRAAAARQLIDWYPGDDKAALIDRAKHDSDPRVQKAVTR